MPSLSPKKESERADLIGSKMNNIIKTDKANTNNYIFGRKRILIIGILSLIWWALTFITDTKIFTTDPLNMSSLPIDTDAVFWCKFYLKLYCLERLSEFYVLSLMESVIANYYLLLSFISPYILGFFSWIIPVISWVMTPSFSVMPPAIIRSTGIIIWPAFITWLGFLCFRLPQVYHFKRFDFGYGFFLYFLWNWPFIYCKNKICHCYRRSFSFCALICRHVFSTGIVCTLFPVFFAFLFFEKQKKLL